MSPRRLRGIHLRNGAVIRRAAIKNLGLRCPKRNENCKIYFISVVCFYAENILAVSPFISFDPDISQLVIQYRIRSNS